MSYYNQQPEPVTAYPPPPATQGAGYAATAPPLQPGQPYAPQANYVAPPPPPPGYPTMNPPPPQVVAPQAQSRGDKAFWEGCCAALCCCCLLDMCC